MRWASAIAAAAVLTVSVAAGAPDDLLMDGEPQVVGTVPVSLYRPHLDDRRVQQETWDYVFWFPSGHRLLAQFQVTNAGPGTHTGLVAGLIIFPDKTSRLIKNSRPRDEWKDEVSGGDVRLTLARHVFEVGARRHHLHVESRVERFDVEAESVAPGVTLGTVRYSEKDRYELIALAPRVRCTATVQVDGQAPVTLTGGGGIALHSLSTLADYEQALSVLRLHTFDGPLQTSLLAFAAPRGRRAQSVGWLLLMPDGQPIEVVRPIDRQYSEIVKEHEDPGYRSPRRLHMTSAGPAPIDATISLSLVGRFDILTWINTALGRFLARRFFHPVQYLFDSRYEVQFGTATHRSAVAGTGFGILSILNQPGGEWP